MDYNEHVTTLKKELVEALGPMSRDDLFLVKCQYGPHDLTNELVGVWRIDDDLLVEISHGPSMDNPAKPFFGVTYFKADGERLTIDQKPSHPARDIEEIKESINRRKEANAS